MHQQLRRFVEFVLGHRLAFTVAVVVATLVSLSIVPRAVLQSSLEAMFFGENHPGFTTYKERIAEFGSDEVFLFVIPVEHPLGTEVLDQLADFHERAEARPEVRRVTSVLNMERTGLVGETIGVRNYSELARENPEQRDALLAEIREDPIAGGLLVSKKTNDVLVMVEMTPDPAGDAQAGPARMALMLEDLARSGYDLDEVRRGGLTSVLAEMIDVSRKNLYRMFPIAAVMLLLAVFLMFGRMWPVVVTTTSALLAVTWTVAFSIAREPAVNILMSVLPMFVMIISFSDVVHMCSAYLLNLEGGDDKRTAVVEAVTEVGAACFLTSVSTAIGFVAMAWVPAPAFQHLGIASAFGVLCAYVLAMVLVPIMLMALPMPRRWHDNRMGAVQSGLDRLLGALAHLTSRRPWPVIAVWAVIVATFAYGSSLIEFENTFSERLAESNRVRIDQDYIEDRFIESTLLDIYVETPDEGGVLGAERFAQIRKFEEELESWPEVEKVVSLVDLMRATHASVVGEGAEFGAMSDEALAQLMVLLEMPGPDALASMTDFERSTVRLTVYSNEPGIVGQYELQQRMSAKADQMFADDVDVDVTGIAALMGGWLDDLLAGQRHGLGFSLVVIMILLIFGFRSLRAGVVSMIPNVIPLLAAGAFCGFLWEEVDSDTLLVAMVAIGIGVDDTIHFISRYQLEATRHDVVDALRETFRYSGRGIFITTFVFVVGFLPAMLSDYYSIWVMGLLLPICFVVALLADLLLVPALIKIGAIR